MSENIRGITFAEQAVTPADDAIVRRAILGDGVLTGCEVTYSGSTLTLASGYIIACGRSFQITTAQNFAVVDATSGVARLLLTIDLTQTATEETFNQISFSIEYAAAEDGFVDLIQDDINLSGTKYQIVCAVVSLGTGGITGIVSKLERTEGGGGGLNFKVVPGLTQPGTASENTIWVKTERIGAWYFSATQPDGLQEWDVWFGTGTESDFAFNALRKNAVQVYPLSAKQMISGELVDVEAMSYQAGEWVEWITILYKDGILGKLLANGFDKLVSTTQISYESDRIKLYDPSNNGSISSPDKINCTGHKSVSIKGRITFQTGAQSNYKAGLATAKNANSFVSFVTIPISTSSVQDFSVNVPPDGGSFYLIFTVGDGTNSSKCVEITEMILTK